jgi:hypothetical protein
MSEAQPPTSLRIALLAWEVIDKAYREAEEQPIERSALHKLALGYLLVTDFAAAKHVRSIWAMLGHEGTFAHPTSRQAYYGPVIYGIRDRIKSGRRLT